MSSSPRPLRDDYRFFHAIVTRWKDNDVYGHVNNVEYYSWFDTAVNFWLISRGLLDITESRVVGIVVETGCRFHAPVAFPDLISVGIRAAKLGNSSVRYEAAVFRNDDDWAAADGHFVHVFVDRGTMRPVSIPDGARRALAEIAG
jgi:acyl-CoA thioester hydrolase